MLIKGGRVPLRTILTVGILPSWLKIVYYRLKGAKIGRKVHIGFGSVIIAKKIEIGDYSRIGFGTIIRGREVHIANHVRIASFVYFDVEKIIIEEDAKINELVFAGGLMLPESLLHIGKRALIMQMSFLNPTKPLIIGDDTGVGGTSLLFTHGVWQSILDGYPVTYAPVTLGRNVWLPWAVFVMPGVTIGDNATIGAASLVNKDVPPGALAYGSPAKVIRTADEYPPAPSAAEIKQMIERIITAFIQYLKYHQYTVVLAQIDGAKRYDIMTSGKVRCGILYYLEETTSDFNRLELDSSTVVLSRRSLSSTQRKHVEQTQAAWIEIDEKRSSAFRNDLAEEILVFLERYGLRFVRCQKIEA